MDDGIEIWPSRLDWINDDELESMEDGKRLNGRTTNPDASTNEG